MKIELTNYHDLIVSHFDFDCQSESWNINYSIRDNLTGLIKTDSLLLDQDLNGEEKSPKEILNYLVEFLKNKGYK